MPAIYLIDFENVGNKWAGILENAKSGDTAVLFYSDNSPKAMLDQMEKIERMGLFLKFRHCGQGHNGLDFQLSSELGYLIGTSGRDEYFIISDDSGYDVLAAYWAAEGVKVSRRGTAFQKPVPSEPRQALYDALEKPMAADGLLKRERMHVMGCARACLEQEADPAARMERFRADTVRYRGRRTMERLEAHVVPALKGIFAIKS